MNRISLARLRSLLHHQLYRTIGVTASIGGGCLCNVRAEAAMTTICDTIEAAAELASSPEDGTYDPRRVFLVQVEAARLDEHYWLLMLGHLLAFQADSQASAMPPKGWAVRSAAAIHSEPRANRLRRFLRCVRAVLARRPGC